MTPEQLELAARHYCKLMGLDPDEKLMDEHAFFVERWRRIAQELRVHWAMNEALKEGMQDPGVEAVINGMFPSS